MAMATYIDEMNELLLHREYRHGVAAQLHAVVVGARNLVHRHKNPICDLARLHAYANYNQINERRRNRLSSSVN